jgi:hypothetical protein
MSVFSFHVPPERFDELRKEFREFADGEAESLPRVQQEDNADVWHGFCYNHEWLAFAKWLIDRGDVKIERIIHAEKGSYRMSAAARNDVMTPTDEGKQAHILLAEEDGRIHESVKDYASSMSFQPV